MKNRAGHDALFRNILVTLQKFQCAILLSVPMPHSKVQSQSFKSVMLVEAGSHTKVVILAYAGILMHKL
ncbi:hypothetical protein D7004_00305 [Pedobacter jejuensis]|uniref:Uncharacterized protein n=1 Tax=Pedobacter jejuensis TaxID=1268550 RepID=A0A3N0C2V7_9SPHI|nr:hypothetical protein D7004_00305 [Pedobacter jejuensis]